RLSPDPCLGGRTHVRMWPVGRKSDEVLVDGLSVLPLDVWGAVESVDACAMGLFQIIRTARTVDRLRLRVGYASDWSAKLDGVRDGVRAAVLDATGTEPDVELVPNDALLRLGPPHKIPRVSRSCRPRTPSRSGRSARTPTTAAGPCRGRSRTTRSTATSASRRRCSPSSASRAGACCGARCC